MARISGVNIPSEKCIGTALTYIYGVGPARAKKVLAEIGIDEGKRTKDLSEPEINQIRDALKEYKLEGDLKRDVLTNIRRLKTISSYRGDRHSKHLPARGQRTKTNSRTVRGNVRKTMGSGKVKVTKT